MSSQLLPDQPILPPEIADQRFLQPPPGRRYVRSFLFSHRVDAPLSRLHLIARTLLVFCLSAALLRTMNTEHPDLISTILLSACGTLLFGLSGMHAQVIRLQLLLCIFPLLMFFLTWLFFHPTPGQPLAAWTLYDGTLPIGLALWQPLWLLLVVGIFYWKRSIITALLLASGITLLISLLLPLPVWTISEFALAQPWTLTITSGGLLLATTKVLGYLGMILATIALVVSSRDNELTGTLIQLRMPQPVIFFLSTVSRALNLALVDYETIYQAQIARAINARPRSLWQKIGDLVSISVPMVAVMLRRSSEIGDALLARGYRLNQVQTRFYETSPWRPIDWGILICCFVLLIVALGPYPNLTTLVHI